MSVMEGATHTKKAGQTCSLRGIGISKRFGQVQALQDVDIEINRGEVLALVGDNGAGKSTLIKCLCGVYEADSGKIEVNDQPVHITDPHHARELGIATVFQELALVDYRDVATNVFLGNEPTRFKFFVDKARMIELATAALSQLRINIPSLAEEVIHMSGGERQAIAVARALAQNADTVILDEPTAALGVQQAREVLDVIHRLRDEGVGIVVISHNLAHIFSVADYIMVLRHGQKVGVKKKTETSSEEIVKMIVGVAML